MQTVYCGFCSSLGIDGPHDHYMRSLINREYKTICPILLNTECQKCFKKGHTSRYCRNNLVKEKKFKTQEIIYKGKQSEENKKEKKTENMWALLSIDSNDTSDDDSENNICDKPYVYMNWGDIDTDDEELPPLPKNW